MTYSQNDILAFINAINYTPTITNQATFNQSPFQRLYNNDEALKLFMRQHALIKKYSLPQNYKSNLNLFLSRYGLNASNMSQSEIQILQSLLNYDSAGNTFTD